MTPSVAEKDDEWARLSSHEGPFDLLNPALLVSCLLEMTRKDLKIYFACHDSFSVHI